MPAAIPQNPESPTYCTGEMLERRHRALHPQAQHLLYGQVNRVVLVHASAAPLGQAAERGS